ncbi:MAG: hypothetical protein RRC07_13995 [Anaerolineae bacterium]|nr:hypothetical protein [Anaerolineae bacterium]
MIGSPLDRDRLGVVSAALLLALAVSRLLDVAARRYEVTVFGSPLGLTLSATTLLYLFVAGLAATGMHSLLQYHTPKQERRDTLVFWLLPALTGIALLAWLAGLDDLGVWTLAMLAAAILIPVTFALEFGAATATLQPSWQQWLRLVLIHLVALIFFYALYDARLRLLGGAPLLLGFGTLLAFRLFWHQDTPARHALGHAFVVATIQTQFYWMLNYIALSSLRGGVLLMLSFYLVAGLLPQLLGEGRRLPLVREYALVGLLAVALILLLVP